jgi:hypothetical protein
MKCISADINLLFSVFLIVHWGLVTALAIHILLLVFWVKSLSGLVGITISEKNTVFSGKDISPEDRDFVSPKHW